jgi:hypothetical protein
MIESMSTYVIKTHILKIMQKLPYKSLILNRKKTAIYKFYKS